MSRDNESVMSSAISISGADSFSDDGSTRGVGEAGAGIIGSSGNGLFDLGDGDFQLIVCS